MESRIKTFFYSSFLFQSVLLQCILCNSDDLINLPSHKNYTSLIESQSQCAAKESCADGNMDGICHCDRLCVIFNDCCHDADRSAVENKLILEAAKRTSCLNFVPYNAELDFVSTVNSCPSSASGDIIPKCVNIHPKDTFSRDVLLYVPVTEKGSGLVFKNIYCAVCNGFGQNDVYFWKVLIQEYMEPGHTYEESKEGGEDYDGQQIVADFITSKINQINGISSLSLKLEYPTDLPKPRFCIGNTIVAECAKPEEYPSFIVNNCTSGKYALSHGAQITYKNYYCALCNGDERAICLTSRVTSHFNIEGSFRMLIDFNTASVDDQPTTFSCASGELYNVYKEQCIALTCEPGYTLKGNQCYVIDGEIPDAFYEGDDLAVCPMMTLNTTDYVILSNRSIYFKDQKVLLNSDEYSLVDGLLTVCSVSLFNQNYTIGFEEMKTSGILQNTISFIFQGISIISLIILLVVYGLNKPLQTIPGKCLMALSGCLLVAQLLFLIGLWARPVYWLCYTFGVFTHFAFLASFCWMNIMAYDVWRTFHAKLTRVSQGFARIRRFLTYSLTMPALIVLIGIILDATTDKDSQAPRPDYGRFNCWINTRNGLIVLFATPVFVLVLTNYMFFIMAVVHIHKAATDSDLLRKKESNTGKRRKRLVLYAKLSTLMGLAWIFGFIASVTKLEFLWYLFIAFTTLQGLFMCIAFLCNRKVAKLMKTKLSSQSASSTSSSATRTRSTIVSSSTQSKRVTSAV